MPVQTGAVTSDLLRSAARAIHAERDFDHLLSWVADSVATATDASFVGLAVDFDAHQRRWVMSAGSARDLAVVGDPHLLPQLARVLRGESGGLADDDNLRRVLSVQSVLALPIPRADCGVHGVVALGWLAADDRPAPADLATAESLIVHLGVALDNKLAMADLEAANRSVLHKLQEAVRPPTPTVPQTELGVFYLAADQQASMGEIYDWVLLPDGTLHLAVVDVMGKGVAATKDAVAVTHALRLLVLDGVPLERVIARADSLVTAQNPDLVATLMIGRYDPATGVLELAGGGHPPLLVVQGTTPRWVEVGGIPIGFPNAGSDGVVTVQLDRSDTAIFYTDGLIEATKDIIEGLDALARFAGETANYPAAPLARALVERSLAGAVRNDDSLALVLRRRSPPPATTRATLPPLEYRFTPSVAAVPLARHFLEDWLLRVPVERGEASDLLLVATELCANAVRHASGDRGSVSLRAAVQGADVMLEIEDDGGEVLMLPDPADELPDAMAERGRGLFLVRALVDQLDTEVIDGHTLVRAIRRAVVAP